MRRHQKHRDCTGGDGSAPYEPFNRITGESGQVVEDALSRFMLTIDEKILPMQERQLTPSTEKRKRDSPPPMSTNTEKKSRTLPQTYSRTPSIPVHLFQSSPRKLQDNSDTLSLYAEGVSTVDEDVGFVESFLQTVPNLPSEEEPMPHPCPVVTKATLMQLNRIVLNIGGTKYDTTQETLLNVPDSFFTFLFRVEPIASNPSTYFIDRDPAHFRHVLNHLRRGGVSKPQTLPKEPRFLEELIIESEFYILPTLVQIASDRLAILKDE
ncbi:hypothetical protein SNE40_017857 [Patella caerulea]|uniref:BTB domain-containing protein n=1 Tax=Patella caerulea TaxID=87958 RepID=A0AAN8JB84_PATCE